MSTKWIWRPREWTSGPVADVDISYPIGVGSDMYHHNGEDEEGNPIFEQVGNIKFPDPSNKKVYEVDYYPEYDGPREKESQESKDARAKYESEVQQRADEQKDADGSDATATDDAGTGTATTEPVVDGSSVQSDGADGTSSGNVSTE